uniref:Uncharacterized protein n=1 Tax=Chenopodium quinoa TaxID=63459 RepID=A0A803N0J2_CHEQI
MTKKNATKLGAIRGSGDEHQTHEPRMEEYERQRMENIKNNMSRIQELGLKEQAKSLMAQVQNNRGKHSKNKMKKVSGDDELYRPNQDMEHELDSTDEDLPIPHSNKRDKSNSIQWKIHKMKALTRKAVTTALAKRRQNVDLDSSHDGSSTPNHTLQEPVEMLRLEVEHLNHDKNDKENGKLSFIFNELEKVDSKKEVESVISTIIGNNNKKALIKEVEENHALEVQALQKDYEDKRKQDRREIANGLSSIISQLQQQNPQMSFDLSMFGSLFLDSQCDKDDNTTQMLRLQHP